MLCVFLFEHQRTLLQATIIAMNFVHAFRVETPQILPPNGAKLAVLEGGNLLQNTRQFELR